MSDKEPLIDVPRVLAGLKDFQRRSVEHVFDRLYGQDPVRRFLIADEVGLGKTLVARGLIVRTIEHLDRSGVERIDIVYICSNADIARQNINRLNVTGRADCFASRITLLPTEIRDLKNNRINLISFTPGTSFELKSSMGTGRERWLLYWLLRQTYPKLSRGAGPMNLLQGAVGRDTFRRRLRSDRPRDHIDPSLARAFRRQLRAEDRLARRENRPSFRNRYRELVQLFRYARRKPPLEHRQMRNAFIGDLRNLLAATCIRALEPDLIILDEFQRFRDILHGEGSAADLARHLFTANDARVVLLSATPYKMYTMSHEAAEEDHYADFLRTMRFLFDDDDRSGRMESLLERYRRETYRLAESSGADLLAIKAELEKELKRVMCRTERLSATPGRSGMLTEVVAPPARIKATDLRSFLGIQRVAEELGAGSVVEYWKSSPYLLNFMEDYKLKQTFRERCRTGRLSSDSVAGLNGGSGVALPFDLLRRYRSFDPGHPHLRRLIVQMVDTGIWRMLWMPPSLAYHELGPAFQCTDASSATKRLIFSSWHVVPKAIASLLSYEVERRMACELDADAVNTPEAREKRRPLLMFRKSAGRLGGMPVLALLYPSPTLCGLGDPLRFVPGANRLSAQDAVDRVAARVSERLKPLTAARDHAGPEDEAWYWAAPLLLDASAEKRLDTWFADTDRLAELWCGSSTDEDADLWREHVGHAAQMLRSGGRTLGRPPADLPRILAEFALAAPGNTALRAICRHGPPDLIHDHDVRHGAGRIAWSFRSLFNLPEVTSMIRGMNGDEPYWLRVLEYCRNGCLQAVLDEYVHVLRESEGLLSHPDKAAAVHLAGAVAGTVGMRAASPGVDEILIDDEGRVRLENHRLRARFAMRFGQERVDEYGVAQRADTVRAAFNSPFWPFVLATTSVGQEGLDFHPYCHAVMHWNLPSNPVDMEQREGRVHRYKGHAVRRNIARRYGGSVSTAIGDVWTELFELASSEVRDSDLTPFWVYPLEGGATIERHVPTLPLSREWDQLPSLRSSLAVYRMVFGQPRQDDLVQYLLSKIPRARIDALLDSLRINLEPMGGAATAPTPRPTASTTPPSTRGS